MMPLASMAPLDFAQYAAIDAVNWSSLKELRRSPLHYQHRLIAPLEDSPALSLGRAVHCAVFEPDMLPLRYVVYAESKSRGEGARKKWEAFQAVNQDREILDIADWRKVCAIRDSVRANVIAAKYLADGKAEQAIQWVDKSTGLRCKARLDWIGSPTRSPCTVVDLKTTRDLLPHKFASQAASLGYHGQLAFYLRGMRQLYRPPFDCEVRLIAVESEPPHDVVVYSPDEDWLEEGDALVSQLLEQVATRRKSGCWPGIALGQELELSLPRWAMPSEDESAGSLGLTFGGGT